MSDAPGSRLRLVLLAIGAPGLLALVAWGMVELPPAGRYRGPYGYVIDRAVVAERHVTDAVSAVNFDYRALDTLGEEMILFASVVSVALLLRRLRDERDEQVRPEHAPGREVPPTSGAVRGLGLALVGACVVFGAYVVTHGQLTPGGGFQGGVIAATAPVLVYLAAEYPDFRRLASHEALAMAEAVGAAGYVLIGIVGMFTGAAFLENVLPLGAARGTVLSGGTIPLVSLATGVEVGAGFVLLLAVFLEETLERAPGGRGR